MHKVIGDDGRKVNDDERRLCGSVRGWVVDGFAVECGCCREQQMGDAEVESAVNKSDEGNDKEGGREKKGGRGGRRRRGNCEERWMWPVFDYRISAAWRGMRREERSGAKTQQSRLGRPGQL